MQESFSLVAERASDLAVQIIAIFAAALLVLQTIYLVVFTHFITTKRTDAIHARREHGHAGRRGRRALTRALRTTRGSRILH